MYLAMYIARAPVVAALVKHELDILEDMPLPIPSSAWGECHAMQLHQLGMGVLIEVRN